MNTALCSAKWIWLPAADMVNMYVDFRTEFLLPSGFSCVTLYISADSHYAAYVNGQHVPATQYADYPHYKVYDEIEITRYATVGTNTVCIVGYCQNEDSSVYRVGTPGLLFAVKADNEIVAISGHSTLCRLSKDYQSGNMERFSPQLSYSFRYRGTAYDGWLNRCYVPSAETGWLQATETSISPPLFPRPIKPLDLLPRQNGAILSQGVFIDTLMEDQPCGDRMQRAALSFRRFHEMSNHTYPKNLPFDSGVSLMVPDGDGLYVLIDLGCETAGYFELDIFLKKDAMILIGFGEHLDDLRVRTSVGGRQFAAVYEGRSGRQRFAHWFKRIGCRYVQLHIYAHEAILYYAGVRPAMYPMNYKKEFHCADALHNKIFEVSRRTLELCMHEHYEDCPWREQALYAMDSRNQMLCGYYVFEDFAFAQASLRLLALGQQENGLLELCAPARVPITIPSFSLCFVVAVYENLIYSGDVAFAQEMLPTMEIIMESFLSRIGANGLMPCFTEPAFWNFYEWKDGLDGGRIFRDEAIPTTYDAPLNGFLSLALGAIASFYDILGDEAQKHKYEKVRNQLNSAMSAFWDEDKQSFCTFIQDEKRNHYCELSQALLSLAGSADDKQSEIILNKLAHPDGSLIPTTLSCSIYKYEALMQRPNVFARTVMDEIAGIWGKMLFAGATSFWETDLGAWDFDNAGSLCHGWSAIPIYFYYRYVLGIIPQEDLKKPLFCGLYEVEEI